MDVIRIKISLCLLFCTCVWMCTMRLGFKKRGPCSKSILCKLPSHWDWRNISKKDAQTWRQMFGKPLATGCYTSRIFNQHMSKWCGCCYLIAVIQSIQDKLNVRTGQKSTDLEMKPFIELDMQIALDAYNMYKQKTNPEWNACHGGNPETVIQAIRCGHVPLIYVDADGFGWYGHARTVTLLTKSHVKLTDDPVVLKNIDEEIQLNIMAHGSIVLGINSNSISEADEDGFVNSQIFGAKNHAVCVVGWKTVMGKKHWIVRNSWGTHNAPAQKPQDTNCVKVNKNICQTKTVEWSGDKNSHGYVYIPFDYAPIKESHSSWFFCCPDV